MPEKQLFPVFELPQIPDSPEYDERYQASVYFDFEKGDFVRDGANKLVRANGKEAYLQWCLKTISTERLTCLAYSDQLGTEFEEMDTSDRESTESEIEKTITESLLIHPATEYVRDFLFTHNPGEIRVSFLVKGYPWEDEERLEVKI